MEIGVIILARMSSKRLPGKALRPLAGKPVLQYAIEAVQRVPGLAGVLVATSEEGSDDPIAMWCEANQVACFRGSLENVAERFLQALLAQGWEAAVRISADSPLLPWRLIDAAHRLYRRGQYDLVTNVLPRTYPRGQSVEVVSKSALQQAYQRFSQPADFEHVTSYFYRHAQQWRIGRLTLARDQSGVNLAVDTAEDLTRLEGLMKGKELVL